MANNQKGGGFGSRQHVSVGQRLGDARKGYNVRGVSQIGSALGNKITERSGKMPRDKVVERVRTDQRGISVPLGNTLATNVGKGGPGTGRTLYGQSGTNQTYGPVAGNPKPQGRDILREYGPDYKR